MDRIDNIQELRANNILVFDNFLRPEECNEILLLLDHDLWEQSTVVSSDKNKKYTEIYSSIRTNKVCHEHYFSIELKKIISNVENKITGETDIDVRKIEPWQISKYGYEDKFDFHNDCGYWSEDPRGEREWTIVLYLMSPSKGGETYFRALNLYVRPLTGRLVVWKNLLPNGNCNYAMIHSGLPVKEGIKIILNTWLRQFHLKLNKKKNERSGTGH